MAAQTDWPGLIAKAYEYAFPAFEQAWLAYNFSYSPKNPARVPLNHFSAHRALADYTSRATTTPNNDTLYSSAAIDLSAGPVQLDVPDFGARYFSVALLDFYTNNFYYISTRTNPGGGGHYWIAGPRWKGRVPEGMRIIHAPSDHVMAFARIFVSGPSDYATVHRLQDQLILTAPASSPHDTVPIVPVMNDPLNFVAVVNQVLRENPPPAADKGILKILAVTGMGARARPLSDLQQQMWRRYFGPARATLIAQSRQVGRPDAGWEYAASDVGNFGTDYKTRAMIALRGIWASIPAELIYTFAALDRDGAPLEGNGHYILHLPAGAPPAAFWSLSIYEMTPTGELFFGANPIQRYALGSLVSDLARNTDGSIDILIQRNRPAGRERNWLPIPAQHFALIMRAYLPGPALRDGQFQYPGIVRVQ